jgi:hypothetical protein
VDEQEKTAPEAEQKDEKTEAADKPRVDVTVEVPCLGIGAAAKEPGR